MACSLVLAQDAPHQLGGAGPIPSPGHRPQRNDALTGVNPRSIMKLCRQPTTNDIATLRQRLFRLLWSSMTLSNSTIKILERLTIQLAPPEHEDIADLTDRLHEAFNAYSFLTRSTLWQDIEDAE